MMQLTSEARYATAWLRQLVTAILNAKLLLAAKAPCNQSNDHSVTAPRHCAEGQAQGALEAVMEKAKIPGDNCL